jgi:peptide/nickel transport system substrate-binding protein
MQNVVKVTTYLVLSLFLVGGLIAAPGIAGANTLNFALSGNPDSLDPHKTSGTLTFQTLKSVYDTLAEPDMSGKIVPALAQNWEVSDDALTWTFHLRKGVVFHNGDKLTSQDVKATLQRITDKATASPNAKEFGPITAIETPDDHTVVLKLKEPHSPLLASLSSGWGAILPKALIDSGHDFAAKPVGTGPFKLKEWVRDSRIVLVKNDAYWMSGIPKLDEVDMHIIPERSIQVQGLISGQIDVSYIINQDDIPLLAVAGQPGCEVRKTADLPDHGDAHELQPSGAEGHPGATGNQPCH